MIEMNNAKYHASQRVWRFFVGYGLFVLVIADWWREVKIHLQLSKRANSILSSCNSQDESIIILFIQNDADLCLDAKKRI